MHTGHCRVLGRTPKASTALLVCKKQLACVMHRHRFYSTAQCSSSRSRSSSGRKHGMAAGLCALGFGRLHGGPGSLVDCL